MRTLLLLAAAGLSTSATSATAGEVRVITAPGLGCRIQVDIPVASLTDQVAS